MNDLATITQDTLPNLIDSAAAALQGARSSAEVLEARDMARVAYDAARRAGRIARAKAAHDEVIAAVYRAQANAAAIEARAKVRLADEYDAAQARGEVATRQNNPGTGGHVGDGNMPPPTTAQLGLRRDEIHDARRLRDAERAKPGRIEEAAAALAERGEEPTKAALRREILGDTPRAAPPAVDDPDAPERRKLARLTIEALIDEVLGLRAALAEERAKRKAAEAEAADLKERIAAFEADDLGRALGNAQRRAQELKGRLGEIQSQLARETRRANAMQKARDELQRKLEMQEIPLGPAA